MSSFRAFLDLEEVSSCRAFLDSFLDLEEEEEDDDARSGPVEE